MSRTALIGAAIAVLSAPSSSGAGAAAEVSPPAEAPARPVIVHRVLDPDRVTVVPTAPGITTTLVFPGPVEGMDGVGVSPDPNAEGALFNLSHAEGSDTFSITPLKMEARTNINVRVGEHVYVLLFLSDPERALFKMVLSEPPPPAPTPQSELASRRPETRDTLLLAPARMLGLIDKCKAYAALNASAPSTVEDLRKGTGPFQVSNSDEYSITPLEVYRKGEWDALVFKVAITNHTDRELYYDPESFVVRVGSEGYTQAIADAGGQVPPKTSAVAWFVMVGDQAGGSNNLDPDNSWQITVQLLKEAPPSLLPPLSPTVTYEK
jgi:hypothetical protein